MKNTPNRRLKVSEACNQLNQPKPQRLIFEILSTMSIFSFSVLFAGHGELLLQLLIIVGMFTLAIYYAFDTNFDYVDSCKELWCLNDQEDIPPSAYVFCFYYLLYQLYAGIGFITYTIFDLF